MDAEWVMSAIVGAAGLAPTLAAAKTGAIVALANKESIVCAGPMLMETARRAGGAVIPVDSEHSAIFQVLQADCLSRVARLILTALRAGRSAAGRRRPWARRRASRHLAHPNWNMGAKISDRSSHHDEQGPGNDRGGLPVLNPG